MNAVVDANALAHLVGALDTLLANGKLTADARDTDALSKLRDGLLNGVEDELSNTLQEFIDYHDLTDTTTLAALLLALGVTDGNLVNGLRDRVDSLLETYSSDSQVLGRLRTQLGIQRGYQQVVGSPIRASAPADTTRMPIEQVGRPVSVNDPSATHVLNERTGQYEPIAR